MPGVIHYNKIKLANISNTVTEEEFHQNKLLIAQKILIYNFMAYRRQRIYYDELRFRELFVASEAKTEIVFS